jgi:histidinol-phosphate/aromatic aminotransferase/cobyric acid decarboxylase-like protein
MVRESLAIPVPTFGRWTDQPMETGKRVDMFPLQESSGFVLDLAQYAEFIRKRNTKVAVICNPNNPDGGFIHKQALVQFMDAMADLDLVIIDESFLEFADAEVEPSVVQEAMLRPNVVVLRSLGKNFGLHGIRFGYLVANPALAGRIRSMLPKWNLNAFAEHVVFILKEHGAEYAQSLQQVRRDRLDMASHLSALPGLTVYPSQGNFLFVRLPVGAEGTVVRDRMLTEHRILVRECGNKIGSSSRFLRLVVRPQTDVRRLVSGMEQVLYGTRRGAAVPELGTGTNYSSGTAAVDRLVGATNGAGMQNLAAQALLGTGTSGVGMPTQMPMPAVAQMPMQPQPVPMQVPQPQPQPQPQQQPQFQPMAASAQVQQMPRTGMSDQQSNGVGMPMQMPQQMPQQAPPQMPQQQPYGVPAPAPAPMPQGPTPTGVPARNGLTAAQVRGATSPNGMQNLAPAPATGWPNAQAQAQSWPNAAGMGQAG